MAAHYDPSDELQSELQCCVCQDTYADPVDLSCGHSFCRECVLNTFATTPRERGEERVFLNCPVCRKRHFTSVAKINKMSVNFKLRNIVSAFGEKHKVKADVCETHKKPYVLFCYDCDDLKCLSCFLKGCTNPPHKTEEVDDVASKIKSSAMEKVQQCAVRLKAITSDVEKGSTMVELRVLTEGKLADLVDRMDHLCMDLLHEERQDVEKVKAKLEGYMKSANSSLVKAKVDVEAISVPDTPGSKLTGVSNACKDVTECIKSAIDKFANILKEHGRDKEEEEEEEGSGSRAGGNGEGTATNATSNSNIGGATCSQNSADGVVPTLAAPRWSLSDYSMGDFGFPDLDMADRLDDISPSERHTNLYHYRDTAGDFDGFLHTGGELTSPLLQISVFDQDIVNSVAAFPPDFVACTTNGCSTISPGLFGDSLMGTNVKAVCLILPNKVLVACPNLLKVHRLAHLDRNDPIYILPQIIPQDCEFECIAVTGTEPSYYLVSDTRDIVINVWNSTSRMWCDPINVATMLGEGLSFKMCARNTTVYIAIRDIGQVRAVNLEEDNIIWRCFSVVRPNGIAVDDNSIYVCESLGACIVILNLDGTVRQTILQNHLEYPFSVAASNGKLTVVERDLQHDLELSPIQVFLFDLNQVLDEAI